MTGAGKITLTQLNRPDLEWMPTLAEATSYVVPTNLNQTTSANGTALVGNVNGNLDQHGTTDYQWTYGNRLWRVVKPASTTEYAYDSTDRRTVVIEDGVMTRTLWSGADEVGQYASAGGLVRRFIPDGSGAMDARLAMVASDGTVSWFHTNHQGSVVAMSNASGAATAFANYSEYGKFGSDASGNPLTAPPSGSPFGYTGRQWDAKAGLYNYRARYYDPALGVFLSMDPVGTKDDPNLYMYVGLDPVNNIDPDGEQIRPPPRRPTAGPRAAAPRVPAARPAAPGQAPPARYWQPPPGSPAARMTFAGPPGDASSFARNQAAQADAAGVSLASNQPGAQFQRHNVEQQRLSGPPAGAQQAWEGPISSQTAPPGGLTAYRTFGGGAAREGSWLSPTPPRSSAEARSSLALPPSNAATYCCAVNIPAGTRYQSGTAAGAFGQSGGGQQIQLLEPIPSSSFGQPWRLPAD